MVHRTMMQRTLETLAFDNTYARLPPEFYAKLNPTPFEAPLHLIHANRVAATLIDLDPGQFERPEFAELFGGKALAPGMEPLAMLYSGHQFEVYVPQLGDGRAIRCVIITFEQEFLGRGPDEVRALVERDLVVLQLKGASRRPNDSRPRPQKRSKW